MGEPVFEQLEAFFASCGWRYETSCDRTTVCIVFDGKAGPWSTFVRAFEDEQQVAVYGVLPFKIAAPQRVAAAELVARINFGIVVGNFELDFTDGEIRYRTSLDFEGDRLSDTLLLHLVRANLTVMDRYLPAFVAFASSDLPPVDAIALVE